jgi:hypothetical protein
MSRNKKEFDIGDILLHIDDKDKVVGWISGKQDFGFGIEYTVDWADGYCNNEFYSCGWIAERVELLQEFLDSQTS